MQLRKRSTIWTQGVAAARAVRLGSKLPGRARLVAPVLAVRPPGGTSTVLHWIQAQRSKLAVVPVQLARGALRDG